MSVGAILLGALGLFLSFHGVIRFLDAQNQQRRAYLLAENRKVINEIDALLADFGW